MGAANTRERTKLKLSTDRILTTHVGSLPRPDDLLALLQAEEQGHGHDAAALADRAKAEVAAAVARQVDAGIDVVSDGEMSKIAYTFYVKHRLDGIGAAGPGVDQGTGALPGRDMLDHPDFLDRLTAWQGQWIRAFERPYCIGPVAYADHGPLERDLANLGEAVAAAKPVEAFMNAASPGVLTKFVPDAHYRNEDAYVAALADAMKTEYEAIVDAGYLLQIDCPDLGSARHNQYQHLGDAAFLKIAERNVEAVNHATANIPADRMRLHICWGNYEGPHTHDVALAKVLPICMKARPAGFLFEGANPRHEHEWEDLANGVIPDDKVLIPGVIDSTSNFVEHPRLIAQRLCRYADIVGRERVIASADCGFGTFAAAVPQVATSIVWSKFRALAEGARIATERLWSR